MDERDASSRATKCRMFIIIATNIVLSIFQIPIIYECHYYEGDCDLTTPHKTTGVFRTLYIVSSSLLAFIYFIEIIIFVVVILNVRRLFKFMDAEYYNKLRLPIGLFVIFTITFMFFRIAFFLILQFQLD